MSVLLSLFSNLLRRQEGQTLAEYALILFLIAVVAIVALTALGVSIIDVLGQVTDKL